MRLVTGWTLTVFGVFLTAFTLHGSLPTIHRVLIIKAESESQRPNRGREDTISALNAAIEAANLAERVSSIAPANAVFGFVRALLILIRVRFLPLCHDMLQVHIQLSRIQR